jgi:hypothetical protein
MLRPRRAGWVVLGSGRCGGRVNIGRAGDAGNPSAFGACSRLPDSPSTAEERDMEAVGTMGTGPVGRDRRGRRREHVSPPAVEKQAS